MFNQMWIEPIDSQEFLRVVRSANAGCVDDLARRVAERWTPQQLCGMFGDPSLDVRKLACVVLGLVGDGRVQDCLAKALRDEDAQINELAEHALWSIWFRGGTHEASRHFCRGMESMEKEDTVAASHHFQKAHEVDPKFAEAFNQCAIAHYLLEEYVEAIDDSRKALALVPHHFGAMAGMGHCHAQMGNFAEAGRCYRRALQINPRMHVVAAALRRIDRCFSKA
jgi:tetratricopeptide (TPR) repeat protein